MNDQIYVGSGTAKKGGALSRQNTYTKGQMLPRYVPQRLDQGWEIVHHGVVVIIPRPDPRTLALCEGSWWRWKELSMFQGCLLGHEIRF